MAVRSVIDLSTGVVSHTSVSNAMDLTRQDSFISLH